jgi:Fe-S-cluster containining protein
VSFYWAELEAYGVPDALTEPLTPLMRCMAGTQGRSPRCVALEGEIGQAVTCNIYPQRPSPCHEVMPGDAHCDRARQRHGLPLLAR